MKLMQPHYVIELYFGRDPTLHTLKERGTNLNWTLETKYFPWIKN